VKMLRVFIAGLILASAFPLGGLADRVSPLVQFAVGMGLLFAISFVLPHYFYRGEPLLPDRKRRPRPH
jgi:amino acid permease